MEETIIYRCNNFDYNRGGSGRNFDERPTNTYERRVERYDRRDGTTLDVRHDQNQRYVERRDDSRRDNRDMRRDPPARDRDERRFDDRRPAERTFDR